MRSSESAANRALLLGTAFALALALALAAVGARAPAQTAQQSARMARGEMLTLTTTYARCGHSEVRREALICDGESAGRAELQALYPGWQLTSLAATGAELSRTLDLPCEQHCLITLSGSRLSIERLRDGQLREVGSAALALEALDPELTARLRAGMLTDTLAQAEALVEDIAS